MKRSTSAMIAAAAMAALLAGEAHAQTRSNVPAMVYAAAVGARNNSTVTQEGANNGAAIAQNGAGNTAGIRQYGRNNTGAITQNGDNNAACLIQIGRNLDGSISQTGDYNNAGVIQTRRGATEVPAEFCSAQRGNGNGRGGWLSTARHIVNAARR